MTSSRDKARFFQSIIQFFLAKAIMDFRMTNLFILVKVYDDQLTARS